MVNIGAAGGRLAEQSGKGALAHRGDSLLPKEHHFPVNVVIRGGLLVCVWNLFPS